MKINMEQVELEYNKIVDKIIQANKNNKKFIIIPSLDFLGSEIVYRKLRYDECSVIERASYQKRNGKFEYFDFITW